MVQRKGDVNERVDIGHSHKSERHPFAGTWVHGTVAVVQCCGMVAGRPRIWDETCVEWAEKVCH